MSALSGVVIGAVKRVGKSLLYSGSVPLYWSKCANWGDALNPFLVACISGCRVRHEADAHSWKYFAIGSILERADRFSIVWGTGLIAPDDLPRQRPHSIHAVRGPLTRAQLVKNGISCPEVYGDPALLLPRYLKPAWREKVEIGIIPHYTDQAHPWIEAARGESGVRVIDVYADTEEFVRDLVSCECILSSSLHGLICADAYGIPNRRALFNNNARIGGDFKFMDYYKSINVIPNEPVTPKLGQSARSFIGAIHQSEIQIDLDSLERSCPFACR